MEVSLLSGVFFFATEAGRVSLIAEAGRYFCCRGGFEVGRVVFTVHDGQVSKSQLARLKCGGWGGAAPHLQT